MTKQDYIKLLIETEPWPEFFADQGYPLPLVYHAIAKMGGYNFPVLLEVTSWDLEEDQNLPIGFIGRFES